MQSYDMTPEEQAYLAHYDITKFDRPSIATDVVVFSLRSSGQEQDIRRLEKRSLSVLLVKRENPPFVRYWSLPGGFCRPSEDVQEAAHRVLLTETELDCAYLKLVGVYGAQGRDPRGWIISNTFMALAPTHSCSRQENPDAWENAWFTIDCMLTDKVQSGSNDNSEVSLYYEMVLTCEEKGIVLKASVQENRVYEGYVARRRYSILDTGGLAFDHARILLEAYLTMKKNAKHDLRMVFDLLPARFTLSELQQAYELVTGEAVVSPNFRRKVMPYVVECGVMTSGGGFRPAQLYARNMEEFV